MAVLRSILTITIGLSISVMGYAKSGKGDEEKKTVIAKMKANNETVSSLTAKMKQRKTSAFMDKEVVTKAQFYYLKPGKYRLDPDNDSENEYIINDKSIWVINQKSRTVTTTDEGEMNFSQYVMGFGNSMESLEKIFEIKVEAGPRQKKFGSYRMHLIPLKSGPLFNKMEKIIVSVRDDLWLPYYAELYESDGDMTIWEFSDFKVNGKIKEDVFRQEVPKGFQVKKYEKK